MRVSVGRSRLAPPAGSDVVRQWFDVDENTPVASFLEQCGLPLQFVDGQGLWAVTIGGAGRVEAVVRQATAPGLRGAVPEVMYASDRTIGELASCAGAAYVCGPHRFVASFSQR